MDSVRTDIRRAESWITEEHLEIRAILDRLQTMSDPYMMLLVLKDLRDKLETHFSREEGDEGLHAVIEHHAPQHRSAADELIREHIFLSRDLTGLVKECNALLAGPLAQLKTNTSRFIERMQAHDAAETEILTDSLLDAMEEKGETAV